jgi:hypothetical protein
MTLYLYINVLEVVWYQNVDGQSMHNHAMCGLYLHDFFYVKLHTCVWTIFILFFLISFTYSAMLTFLSTLLLLYRASIAIYVPVRPIPALKIPTWCIAEHNYTHNIISVIMHCAINACSRLQTTEKFRCSTLIPISDLHFYHWVLMYFIKL